MIGVRLDSGDRVALSIKARRMLDEAGFANAKIVCSGDLDEYMIVGPETARRENRCLGRGNKAFHRSAGRRSRWHL